MLIYSCSDMSMARELSGEWKAHYITAFSDGEKDSITEYLSFEYDEESVDDDGSFTERLDCQTNEITEEDYKYTIHFESSISGRYEVVDGNLYLKYDLTTLEVVINDDDVRLRPKNLSGALNLLNAFFATLEVPQQEFLEDCRKNVYSILFKLYKSNSADDVSGQDLHIEGESMSYKHEDCTIKYTRCGNVNVD